jgi:Protein of unknown function (DUF4079)
MNPAYLHPIVAGAALVLLLYTASLGLRMRQRRRDRAALAALHARWAPWAYGLVAASWAGGLASTAFLRSDLELAHSLHFRTGTLMVLLLTGSALTARRMGGPDSAAREIHPWLGALAALLAAAQAVTGLRITP